MATSPFPGMDPYLEAPDLWRGFHYSFAEELRAQLNQQLNASFYADIRVQPVLEKEDVDPAPHLHASTSVLFKVLDHSEVSTTRTVAMPVAPVVRDIPAFRQGTFRTLEIRRTNNHQLITLIEILSPFNKHGAGLEEYRLKRWRVLNTRLNLVEIDLLRWGTRPGEELLTPPVDTDYVILVNEGDADQHPRRSHIWPVALNEQLPLVPVPLRPSAGNILIDLNDVLAQVYVRGAYERRIDYRQPVPPPALRPEMEAWWQHLKEVLNM